MGAVSGLRLQWVSPTDLHTHWGLAESFLKPAIVAGGNLLSTPYVVDELIKQSMDLFLVVRDNKIAGAAITQVARNARGNFLHVMLAGLDGQLKTLNGMRSAFEKMANDYGMQGITWTSMDDRWESWARRGGYHPRFVEYVKEF